jgi:hypothetical protein
LEEPFLPEGGFGDDYDSIDGSVDLKFENSYAYHKTQIEHWKIMN